MKLNKVKNLVKLSFVFAIVFFSLDVSGNTNTKDKLDDFCTITRETQVIRVQTENGWEEATKTVTRVRYCEGSGPAAN